MIACMARQMAACLHHDGECKYGPAPLSEHRKITETAPKAGEMVEISANMAFQTGLGALFGLYVQVP
jgi:hypothetical protein